MVRDNTMQRGVHPHIQMRPDSSGVLHSVSAGGVYCAKTARARAAALGLDYPGVHGAADLSGPAHDGMHPDAVPFWPEPYNSDDGESAERESYMASSSVGSMNGRIQAHPRSYESTFLLSHGAYDPIQSEYTTDQMLPRGQSVINRKSNFKEVKHVAPPTLAEAPGRTDPVNWDPQGRNKPLAFVYSDRDLAVDGSVPNRRGGSLSGLPLPQSRGRGTYQRGLAGYDLRRQVPVLGFTNKGHVKAMMSRAPALGRQTRIRFPGHLAQPSHRSLDVTVFSR